MKKILMTISVFAMMFAMVVGASAQVGNGGDFTRGAEGSGFRLWAVGIDVDVDYDGHFVVGQEGYINVTITNNTGRALPDVTAWMDGVVIGTQAMAKAGEIKNGDVDKVISKNDRIVVGYDSAGRPLYSQTLSSGQSFTYSIKVDTSKPGTFPYTFETWSRLDNKNWRELLQGRYGLEVTIVEPKPGFPDGIYFEDGSLFITWPGMEPNASSHGQVRITIYSLEHWKTPSGGDGSTDFRSARNSLKIFEPKNGFVDCVYGVYYDVYEGNGNSRKLVGTQYLAFELDTDDAGNVIGAIVLDCGGWFDCKGKCDECLEEELY